MRRDHWHLKVTPRGGPPERWCGESYTEVIVTLALYEDPSEIEARPLQSGREVGNQWCNVATKMPKVGQR